MNRLINALLHPIKAFSVIKSASRATWYRLKYQIILRRARIGKNFRVDGKLIIKGPGRVLIGDNVRIGMTVTPWTYRKDAIIRIGNDVFLNGTRFACANSILVGDEAIIADARIMDTDFHGTDPEHREKFGVDPIVISEKTWITIQCVVLKGVKIGAGSTITPNSVVTKSIPPHKIAGGNPAVVIRDAAISRQS